MCGITGVFEYRSGATVDPERLRRMNDSLTHRGPDDEGSLVRQGVGLAMRRLSIIDVSGGHQPIANEDETVWVVFNGEIYNFVSIRRALEARGHTFRTRSDTEVIVHAYEEWGEACVARFEGMFAFALADFRDEVRGPRLLLARDHFGKKPLYYADVEGALVFGSELKAVTLDPRISRELDPEAIGHFLALKVIPAPFSVFRAVKKLLPAHSLVCDRDGVRIRRYWDFRRHVADRRIPRHEAVAEIRRLLELSVEKRMVTERPLGAFLSGGLDSSAVIAVMSRRVPHPVKTFSVGFEGPVTHNELPRALRIAKHLGTDHHEYLLRPDAVEMLPDLVRYADEPFAISSAIPTLLLAREARQEVTVVLTGDGGDEVFGGYAHYQFERWATYLRRIPEALDAPARRLAQSLYGTLGERGANFRRMVRFLDAGRATSPGQRRLGWANALDPASRSALLAPSFRDVGIGTEAMLDAWLDPSLRAMSPEVGANALDVLVYLPDEMLTKVDRMTMGASLEARSPLLDLQLAEFVAGLSFDDRIPSNRPDSLKRLLREAVTDLLPPETREVGKWGFNVPLETWFRGGASDFVDDRLSPERIRRRGVFDPDAVSEILARFRSGKADASNHVFPLVVFEVWAEAMLG